MSRDNNVLTSDVALRILLWASEHADDWASTLADIRSLPEVPR